VYRYGEDQGSFWYIGQRGNNLWLANPATKWDKVKMLHDWERIKLADDSYDPCIPHSYRLFSKRKPSLFRRDQLFTDFTLISEDEVEFQVHRLILQFCSPFFKSLCCEQWHESSTRRVKLSVSSLMLDKILCYAYEEPMEVLWKDIPELKYYADMWQIQPLLDWVQNLPLLNCLILDTNEDDINLDGCNLFE
jgi:hypothetical protein